MVRDGGRRPYATFGLRLWTPNSQRDQNPLILGTSSATHTFAFLLSAAMSFAGALPSPSVCKEWNEGDGAPLRTVLAWAKVSGPLAAAFYAALETTEEEPYKSLMLMSEDEAAQVTDSVKVNDAKPGPLQLAKIRLIFAAVWHAAAGGEAAPGRGAAVGPPLPDPPAPTSLTAGDLNAVAMNGCVTQTGTTYVRLISKAEYEDLLKNYKKACGADMSKEATPTRAQLSCYIALEKERDTLAVDFAVWGPRADRKESIRAMEWLRWDLDGKMVPLVIYGPPTLAEWLKS